MYIVTDEEKQSYKSSGTIKRGYISIVPLSNEEEIILDDENNIKDFTILDEVYTSGYGILGSVISKQITLNLFKEPDIDLTDREIKAYIGTTIIENGQEVVKYVPYGTYIVQKPENEELTDKTSLEALDYMIKFNKTYKDTLAYPCTLKDVYNSICEQCGVISGTSEFPNQNFSVEDNQFVANETCREVLANIAQLAGAYARIDRDNKLYLKFFSSENTEEITTDDYKRDIKINNVYGPINKLTLNMSQIEGESVSVEDTYSIDTIGVKELIISDNYFLYTQEKREKAINAIWNIVHNFRYVDFEANVEKARPYLDAGDSIKILSEDGTEYYTYLLSNEITFDGGLNEKISATADTETETKYSMVPEISNKLKHTEIVVDKANQQIQEIVEGQDSFSKKLSSTTMKVNEVETKVLGIYDFTKLVKGNNQIILEDALDTNILDLKIYAENIKGLYPKKTLFPSKNLFSSKGGSAITVVVSKVSKGTEFPLIFPKSSLFPKPTLRARSNPAIKKEYKINLPKPLLSYGSTQDLLEIYYDENIGMCVAKTVRYLKKVGNNIVILSKPEEEIITYLNLKLNKGKNYIYLKNIYNWKLEANYIFNTELNKYYATKVESYTKIKETEDTINLEVSKKVNNDEIISAINLSPEKIEIKAGKIDFNGAVSANENFKILEDGSMEAKNGKFSGDIYLGNGGKVLGGNGLYTNLQFNSTSISTSSSQGFGGFTYTGFQADEMNNKIAKVPTCIDAYIPEVFTISSAYITISHIPLDVVTSSGSAGKGNVKNIKIYSSNVENINSITWNILSSYIPPDIASGTEIPNSFEGANNSYTPKNNGSSVMLSKDISSSIKKGSNRILIQSSNSAPTYSSDYNTNAKNCALQSGFIFAQLNVFGYIKTKESE